MPQLAPCPHCDTQLALPAEATTGRSVRCPACSEAFDVESQRVEKLPIASLLPVEQSRSAPIASSFRLPPLGVSGSETTYDGSSTTDADNTGDDSATIVGGPGLADRMRKSEQATGDAMKPVSAPREDAPEDNPPRDPALSSLLDQLRGVGPMPAELDDPPSAATEVESPATPYAEEDSPLGSNLETPAPLSREFEVDLERPLEMDSAPEAEEKPLAAPSDRALPVEEDEALTASPRRGWGVGRLATIAAGGLLGVGLGYGLLSYLGGPAYDSLGLLSLGSAGSPAGTGVAEPLESSFAGTPPGRFEAEATATPLEVGTTPAAFESPSDAPADRLNPPAPASFSSSSTSLYEPTAAVESSAEVDSFEAAADEQVVPALAESPVQPVEQAPTAAAPIEPTEFGYAELSEALVGASEAKGELVGLWLDQGQLEAVGRAYAKLCEVAHVLTYLADDSTHPSMMLTRLEAQDLFQQLFRYQHTRDDCTLVAQRWLSWAERPHGGVFFTGAPTSMRKEGSVFEYRFPLDDGGEIVVLSEESLAGARFGGAEMAGVVGALINSPAELVEGYTGDVEQAVLAGYVFPLSAAEFE